jgi:NAD(P)-dependent dehydrogenase (short-subunit alcohol dehydrogenase family)
MASVLVTGASTGIGEATVRRLVAAGHRVYAGVRQDDDASRLEREMAGVWPVRLDVTVAADVAAVAARLTDELGAAGLDGVVNNAGIAVGGPIEHLPLDEWRRQFEVNLLGPVAVTQAVLPLLRPAKGRVVLVGSILGRLSAPLVGPYAASKHALEALAQSLRQEVRRSGICVALIEPGAVRTPIWAKARADAERVERSLPAEGRARYGAALARMRRSIDGHEHTGEDPDRVAKAIEHALLTRRPRQRYLVGVDARAGGAVERLLPDRVLSAVLYRQP